MREATYIAHTSNGHRYIRDKKDAKYDDRLAQWFETELPGDDIVILRGILINAAAHLSEIDRRFLADNGFVVTTISIEQSWREHISEFLTYVKLGEISDLIFMACKEHAITPGYANIRTVELVLRCLHFVIPILR